MAGVLPPAERRSSALVALYAGLSLFLLMVGDRVPQSALRAVGSTLFSPLDRVVLAGDRLVAAWLENQELHNRLARLEIENARLRIQAEENRTLREQLSLPHFQNPSLRPVEVMALSGDRIPSAITLSSGARGGVREGDIVVTSQGLVGRVAEVYPYTSRAALLTDPNLAVACEVESTGVLGVLRFTATPKPALALTAVPFADTVLVGQRVLTSGLSRRFPRGIPVGTVSSIGKDPGGLVQEITVEPAARFTRLRHVFLIPPEPGAPGRTGRRRRAMRGIGAALSGVIVVLLLRSTLLAGLAARGIVLDALVFATVFWGLRGGAAFGATFGFVIGLCADLDAAHSLGRHALGLSLIGYLVGRLSGTLVRDSVPTQLLLLIAATAVHQAWSIAFEMGGLLSWQEVLLRVVLGAFATGVTGAVILAFSKGWMSPRVVT